ncbi:hypothetical protein A2996_01630 [Candidatus Campbellbacteria bacterium RIFCSPLOWO2_01_FULL_34_15]|uniref:Uncharacterized protein n=2 Tax=Candidatus Campbelliibacteriota TaxID=1752727 RepID=A0A1F5EMB9_9BACT|nr:MAG: hypothetical protein A2996_01630 [Candidatus Campbellbacteria bacterium RIFCSPLOWO2_01_FULL_34_15]OGD69478.1 MAG: hypothetical protein A2811_01660 [Candidatus Campbellbacteria bacterium RIFCSPHIGHO2_01_FULL_34_10]
MSEIFKGVLETGRIYTLSKDNHFVVEPCSGKDSFFEGKQYHWIINTEINDPESTYQHRITRCVSKIVVLGVPSLFEVVADEEGACFSVEITFNNEKGNYWICVCKRVPSFIF